MHLQKRGEQSDLKISVIHENRDVFGKGGTIKPIVKKLNPRIFHIDPPGRLTDRILI